MKKENIINSNMSLGNFYIIMNKLYNQHYVYFDEIPFFLIDDFNSFIIGHTISQKEGKEITYDFKMYYDKIFFGKGISYSVVFN